MIVLAVGSVGLGFFLNSGGRFVDWLAPVLGHPEHEEPVLPVWVLTVAHARARRRRRRASPGAGTRSRRSPSCRRSAPRSPARPASTSTRTRSTTSLLVEPGQALTRSLVYVDRTAIDGTVTGVGLSTVRLGGCVRRLQTGYVRSYAASMLLGLVVLVVVVLLVQS